MKEKIKEEYIGCLYLYMHSLLEKKCDSNGIIDKKYAQHCLNGITTWIPKDLKKVVLFEMGRLGLIQFKTGRSYIIINKCRHSKVLQSSSRLYHYIGAW